MAILFRDPKKKGLLWLKLGNTTQVFRTNRCYKFMSREPELVKEKKIICKRKTDGFEASIGKIFGWK